MTENQTMQRLRHDHAHVLRLLRLLDKQLERIGRGAPAHYAMMSDAVRYLTGYTDRFHHPVEDLVFDRLRRRALHLVPALDGLLAEHRTLGERGQALGEALSRVVDGALVERDWLLTAAKDYLALLRAHMQREEQEVFPGALEHLVEEDWAGIDGALRVREDPLFGRIVKDDFRSLYEYVMRSGR